MTAPVLFGMNSSSSQLLDLLQALRLGHFFSLTYFKATHKKIYSTTKAFQTPTTYFYPTKNPKPCRHLRVEAVLQKLMLQMWCWSNATKDDVAEAVLKCCYKRQCYKGGVEAMLQKTMLQKRCWSDVVEDVAEVVLQKTLL